MDSSSPIPALSPVELGSIAKARREELGLTQQAVAARISTTRRWLREFEQGKPTAQIGVIYRLFTALHLTIAVLPPTVNADAVDLDDYLATFDYVRSSQRPG